MASVDPQFLVDAKHHVRDYSRYCATSWADTEKDARRPKMAFSHYINLVLKQVHPNMGITEDGRRVLDDFLLYYLAKSCGLAANNVPPTRGFLDDKDDKNATLDWANQVHIMGEADGKFLLGTDNEDIGDGELRWLVRSSLPAEMNDKVAAWDTKSDGEKLAALRCSIVGLHQGDPISADMPKSIKNEAPDQLQGCEFPAGGISSRDVQTAVRIIIGGELAKHAVSEGTKAITKLASGTHADQGVSFSHKAGLQFSVEFVGSLMAKQAKRTVATSAAAYMTAVLEYLSAEVLELSGNQARNDQKGRITPRHIFLAFANDEELHRMLANANAAVAGGGSLPRIHAKLVGGGRGGEASKGGEASNGGDGDDDNGNDLYFVGELRTNIDDIWNDKDFYWSEWARDMRGLRDLDPDSLEDLFGKLHPDIEAAAKAKAEAKAEAEAKAPPGRRRRAVLRDNIDGITPYAFGALSARAGVLKLSPSVYPDLRDVTKLFLEELMRDVDTFMDHARLRGVLPEHVIKALRQHRLSRTLFGMSAGQVQQDTASFAPPLNVPPLLVATYPTLLFDWKAAGAAAEAAADSAQLDSAAAEAEVEAEDEDEQAEEEKEKEGDEPEDAIKARHQAALRMIRKEQRQTGPCLPFMPFALLVHEIGQDFKADLHFHPAALRVMVEALQCYLISLLEDANLQALHGERDFVSRIDIQIARRIRGERA